MIFDRSLQTEFLQHISKASLPNLMDHNEKTTNKQNAVTGTTFGIPPFVQSDTDLSSLTPTPNVTSAFIWSEPALAGQQLVPCQVPPAAVANESQQIIAPLSPDPEPPKMHKKMSSYSSEIEVNAQHKRIQRKYLKRVQRMSLTDIDFEGILNLIGGCNKWQLLVYILIFIQQVPHAMFNLNVVYMMYQPDHWCKIDGFSRKSFVRKPPKGAEWTWEKVLNSSIAYPTVFRIEMHHLLKKTC
ncbi:hypothetical protein AB6A40_007534 [Gnathostoma spinigerum]|uniref:Uncharacterized protein n=1 Tax=Gnathostoma spinigerum TaxID=75299 RepID=A0ABD6ELH8_9BILA